MIPRFTPMGTLPPGIHEATWQELVKRFGGTQRRKWLLEGLDLAIEDLRAAGCGRIYVDGSFVTNVDEPGDFDGCFEVANVNWSSLHPALQQQKPPRFLQKLRYHGELLAVDSSAGKAGTV